MKLFEAISGDMVNHLIALCQEELGLQTLPPIEFITDQPFIQSGDKKSFGEFDGRSIKVVSISRHPVDTMRTLAHELVHWKQQQTGQIMDGSDGSDVENEANSLAGVIMRKFGQRYPEHFIDSLPD
jgi:hypothetical protein